VAVYTINASASNVGRVRSYSNTGWSGARSGTKILTVDLAGFPLTGQQKIPSSNFFVYQSYIEFDTSIVAGTITSAVLKINVFSRSNDQSYNIEARLYDFGAAVETADYIAGANLGAYTLLATLADTAATPGDYRTFSDIAMAANVNTSGKTRIMLCDSLTRLDLSPSNENYIIYECGSDPSPPQLIVTTGNSSGSLAKSLSNATVSAAATLAIAGTLALTGADATVTGTANLSGTADGVLSQTLADATAAGTMSVETFGYLDITLDDATVYTEVLVDLVAVASIALDDAVASGVVAWDFTGAASIRLDDAVVGATTASGIGGSLSVTLGDATVQAGQFGPLWPDVYDFPQAPLDGTYRVTLGDDTLRTDSEVGARQYRARNGGNYSDVTFAIMLKSNAAKDLVDRFYRDDCANGATPFYWKDPESGDTVAWLWASPPQIQYVAPQRWRVECALLREAA
jgi:hypothetical protein